MPKFRKNKEKTQKISKNSPSRPHGTRSYASAPFRCPFAEASIDKHDTPRIKSTFEPQSIGAVIRTGVGAAMPQEMEGLRHLMAPDAEMFVSNSHRGQPVEPFLQYMEATFEEIAVAIGLERYAVVCGKPKLA